MRLLSFRRDGRACWGAQVAGDAVIDLSPVYPGLRQMLEADAAGLDRVRSFLDRGDAPRVPLVDVTLEPPVPDTRKLIALAGNYREHIREGGRPTYPREETYPYLFLKPPSTTLIGSGTTFRYPTIGRKLDYEGELVIVIGRSGREIREGSALDHVAGYTILNDLSERELASKEPPKAEREQNRFFDWLVGKWFDGSAPCGPILVTRDEIPDAQALGLRTYVNGELRQCSNTAEMIFTVPEIVAYVSRVMTLEPGDLISTGTPSGVGMGRGVFLQPGDVIEVEIDRIGRLTTPVEAG